MSLLEWNLCGVVQKKVIKFQSFFASFLFQKAALCGLPFCMFFFSLDFHFFSGNLFFLGNLKFKPGHTTKPKNQRILSTVWAKNFLYRHCFYVVFGFPRVFLVFGSGSFYRLLGPPKTKKPRGKPKKTKKPKKPKKPKDSQECLGQGLCSEALVFLVF